METAFKIKIKKKEVATKWAKSQRHGPTRSRFETLLLYGEIMVSQGNMLKQFLILEPAEMSVQARLVWEHGWGQP